MFNREFMFSLWMPSWLSVFLCIQESPSKKAKLTGRSGNMMRKGVHLSLEAVYLVHALGLMVAAS